MHVPLLALIGGSTQFNRELAVTFHKIPNHGRTKSQSTWVGVKIWGSPPELWFSFRFPLIPQSDTPPRSQEIPKGPKGPRLRRAPGPRVGWSPTTPGTLSETSPGARLGRLRRVPMFESVSKNEMRDVPLASFCKKDNKGGFPGSFLEKAT